MNNLNIDANLTLEVPKNFLEANFNTCLTAHQWNIFWYSMYLLNSSESDLVNFKIQDFCELTKINKKKFYTHIKKNIEDIQRLSINFQSLNLKKGSFYIIIPSIWYNNGIINLKFNSDIVKELKNFSQTFIYPYLKCLLELNYSWSKRMYGYFRSKYYPLNYQNYQNINLLDIYSLFGISKNKYKLTADLKINVLDQFIKDNNQNNYEFNLSYEDIKEGKKIVAFKFHIQPKLKAISQQKFLASNNLQVIDFHLANHLFFSKIYHRHYSDQEKQNLSSYLKQIDHSIINYLIYQISLKQPHFAINYLTKILDDVLKSKLNNNFEGVKTKYTSIFTKPKEIKQVK